MDCDIEWLLAATYDIKRKYPDENIYFISDWDCNGSESIEFKTLLNDVYLRASKRSFNYVFSYEQFETREKIISSIQDISTIKISEAQLTIAPTSTMSIYLVSKALAKLAVKRLLLITPTYFSTHFSLSEVSMSVIYYHLLDHSEFGIDFEFLEKTLKEQYIEGVLFTDPLYSSGIEFSDEDYNKLVDLCNKYDAYFVVDYSLGGLTWKNGALTLLNSKKLSLTMRCKKFAFIDSLPKRLFLNGVKFSLLFGDADLIDQIDLMAESVYGGLNKIQIDLIEMLYLKENYWQLLDILQKNVFIIQENFRLLSNLIDGNSFKISATDSGFFSMMSHKELKIEDVDTKKLALHLLEEERLLIITNDRLSYFPDNKLGIRINLSKSKSELLISLNKCIRMPYGRFQRRDYVF